MRRREFIKTGCAACLSITTLSGLLSSCASVQSIAGKLNDDGVLVNADDFKITKKGKTSYHSYIIIRNEELKYPICLYRFNENEYAALWMQCTHQGAELQASGDALQCPAHGSEYNNKGEVNGGPADKKLKSFPVTVSKNQLFIDLRKK